MRTAAAFQSVWLSCSRQLAFWCTIELNKESMPTELAQEPAVMEAVSPLPVLEYMGAHWCGPCPKLPNLGHCGTNGSGGTTSEDFTYISFWNPLHRQPQPLPINGRAHIRAPGVR